MATGKRFPTTRELAERTPPDRDRVVDLVRAVALALVITGHSVMALVIFKPSGAELSNTLAQTPALQPITWVLQIMPLFFAAGAWVNSLSYGRATSYSEWLSVRVRRLLRPVLGYVAFWLLISPVLLAWNTNVALPLLRISTQLLWFLGAYLLVTALTPVLRLGAARPAFATAGWLAAVAVVDLIRLSGGPAGVGLLNFVFGWALAGQTGLWLFDASRRPSRRTALQIAGGAFTANVLMVALGPWPRSMVGLPGERISNMAPPSLVLGLHAITLAALVAASYAQLERLASATRIWLPTVAINAAAMTIYLWHLVALILALLIVHLAGLDLVGYSTSGWVGPRLLFWSSFALLTLILVRTFRPLEHAKLPWWDAAASFSPTRTWSYRWRSAVSVGGVLLTAIALLALSVTGLVGFPFNSSVSYAGFSFTPGLAIGVAAIGLVLIRIAAVGNPTPDGRRL
ncbi:MAG: acyltransferase [Actinomycetes bacterium]